MGLWRTNLGMAAVWLLALGALYVGMERWLQPSSAQVVAAGELHVPRQRDGHFYVDGSINGQPVRLLVDTGASQMAVSDALAAQAGLHGGQTATFHTANGTRTGRLVRAEHVRVGPFEVQNLTVGTGYTGRQPQDALLGQNFLRHVQVWMDGDTLVMRKKSSD